MRNKEHNCVFLYRTHKRQPNLLQVNSRNEFFNKEVVYEIKDGCLIFRRPEIDDNDKILNFCYRGKQKLFTNTIVFTEEIDTGKYYIEEDSGDDEIIVYYGDNKLN